MNPKNFLNAQLGRKRLYDQDQQAEWERARWIACVIINPHLKRAIDPKKLTTFPWERVVRKNKKKDIEKILKESQYQDKLNELRKKKKDA
jgi:alkylated DNA nucleotide flippase Atl1